MIEIKNTIDNIDEFKKKFYYSLNNRINNKIKQYLHIQEYDSFLEVTIMNRVKYTLYFTKIENILPEKFYVTYSLHERIIVNDKKEIWKPKLEYKCTNDLLIEKENKNRLMWKPFIEMQPLKDMEGLVKGIEDEICTNILESEKKTYANIY